MLITKPVSGNGCRYEEPEICPLCKRGIKPDELHIRTFNDNKSKTYLCAAYLCRSCYQVFVAYHEHVNTIGNHTVLVFEEKYVGPNHHEDRSFETCILNVSPVFVEVYNQALKAESSELNQIAGMGYRKALEFLIKDYLIHLDPASEETIKRMDLGNCIANKVNNERIKTVASRSAWIGNDQTHYVQRFEDRDVEDMKKFIDACVYWISMELITEDALSIERRGR